MFPQEPQSDAAPKSPCVIFLCKKTIQFDDMYDGAYLDTLHPDEIPLKTSGKAHTLMEYFIRRIGSILEIGPALKMKLTSLCGVADAIVHKFMEETLGVRSSSALPWRIVLFDKDLEFGFSHTLNKTIYLSSITPIDARLLIHERIHVLQREYPNEFHRYYVKQLHFSHARCRKIRPKIRASLPKGVQIITNPDAVHLRWRCGHVVPFLAYVQGEVLKYEYDLETMEARPSREDHPNEVVSEIVAASYQAS